MKLLRGAVTLYSIAMWRRSAVPLHGVALCRFFVVSLCGGRICGVASTCRFMALLVFSVAVNKTYALNMTYHSLCLPICPENK